MRPDWDEYFMQIAQLVSTRSTCVRRQIGAVIVSLDNRILTTGYNGAPKGHKHCLDVGCLRNELNIPSGTKQEICRAVHAEQNAITQASFHGISICGSIMFTTTFPCSICAKMIINAGVAVVKYKSEYTDPLAQEYLHECDVVTIPM